MGAWFDRLANEQKLFRRLLLVWAVTSITWTTVVIFSNLEHLTDSVADAYGINTALLTVVIGFYQWSRHKEQ